MSEWSRGYKEKIGVLGTVISTQRKPFICVLHQDFLNGLDNLSVTSLLGFVIHLPSIAAAIT